jgi:hypothetical protein
MAQHKTFSLKVVGKRSELGVHPIDLHLQRTSYVVFEAADRTLVISFNRMEANAVQ